MTTTTHAQKTARIHLAGLIVSGNALELPETIKSAAKALGIPQDEYDVDRDWPRLVSKMALQMADAILDEADATEALSELKHPTMDAARAEELRRIAQQANALWRRHGRIRTTELSDIARFLAHWSRAVHVDLYGRDGGDNER